ncbi:MAG TPA: Invasion associated locus B family protein, partial [Bradyrhizobium sp.]
MLFRRILAAFAANILLCGGTLLAQTPGAAPSAAPKAAKSAAKPAEVAKPTAAMTGGAEPTLIGQFGTWGAYSATPNGKLV